VPVSVPASGPRKGGSHRASRHGKPVKPVKPVKPAKPARGWRGRKTDSTESTASRHATAGKNPEMNSSDLEQASDDLSLAMPDLFSNPAEGGVAPSALQELPREPQEPWGQPEPPAGTLPDASRPPWELGGMT
jgi:hypothetical protein